MSNSQRILKEYWSDELGISLEADSGSATVCAHGTLEGYNGIIAFRRHDACILSAPPSLVEDLQQRLSGKALTDFWSETCFRELLDTKIDRIIGPGWLGEINPENFIPCHGTETREIQATEWPLFDQFMAANTPEDQDVCSLESGRTPTIGVFHRDQIVSASGYELKFDKVANIGILTHPEFRGQGFARQAVSAITEYALTLPIGVQYWTLLENHNSVKTARSLGFTQFAETFGIRLK